MKYEEILKKLKSIANPKDVEGMARFGINPKYALGINIPVLRKTAKEILKNPKYKNSPQERHKLAGQLWNSKLHEARILASMVDTPEKVTEKQMDSWIKQFNSWDLCDQVCMNLFDKAPFAFNKAIEWANLPHSAKASRGEYQKRAGYALMACLAWHDKESPDAKFIKFFPHIKRGATDERNFVKKAVNWALRQIGKRNKNLNKQAIKVAKDLLAQARIQKIDNKTAKWIANDALRELTSEKVQERLTHSAH